MMINIKPLAIAVATSLALAACGSDDVSITTTTHGESKSSSSAAPSAEPLLVPEMLNYLNSIKGEKTVIGIHNREPNAEPGLQTDKMAKLVGKWPSLWSGDFLFSGEDVDNRLNMIFEAQKRWRQGMLVQVMAHVCPPTTGESCAWENQSGQTENIASIQGNLSDAEWSSLLTDGEPLNLAWKKRLDNMAFLLKMISDDGVRVLFRPFHEMNQTIFWWSKEGSPEYTASLYRLTHDYLVQEQELTNLTFVWNLQDFATLAEDLDAYDPGPEYYDILTLDNYNTDGTGFSQEKYDLMVAKANGKPIALGEVNKLPTAEILEQQPLWTFIMTWAEETFEKNTDAEIIALYNSPRIVTLDEKAPWSNYDGDDHLILEIPGGGTGTEPDPEPALPTEPFIVFEDDFTQFRLKAGSVSKITESIVDDEDTTKGKVLNYKYTGAEATVELITEGSSVDLSGYSTGTLEFDLKIINEPANIDGNWSIKVDCGWPCGTGDVPIKDNIDGIAPTVGEWQTYKFNVKDLIAKDNGNDSLDITKVTSPLVIFPAYGPNQIGAEFRLDNVKYIPGTDEPSTPAPSTSELGDDVFFVFDDAIKRWKLKADNNKIVETVESDTDRGDVLQHEYIENQTTSELLGTSNIDLSAYIGGQLKFDLKIIEAPAGLEDSWFIKVDCQWPCTTGDINLQDNVDMTVPELDQWQSYTFNVDDLIAHENSEVANGTANASNLDITKVSSPLVILPAWGDSQKGSKFQLDNIRYVKAGVTE